MIFSFDKSTSLGGGGGQKKKTLEKIGGLSKNDRKNLGNHHSPPSR